jgi:uncharacterized protein YndB with AHSA1/START domain
MLGSSTANRDSFKVTTPSDREIRLTRLFDAPRALVFEAMTKPEHVKQWWGRLGEGYSVPVCEIDFRIGGKWRFVNRHPNGEAAFYGEYREITPPSRVVFTEIFEQFPDSVSVVSAELTEEAGKTRLTATVRYPSPEVRDMVMGSGMSHGAGISYDRLEDLLAELQSSGTAV